MAKVFFEVGKKTEVFVRLSMVAGERGGSWCESAREPRPPGQDGDWVNLP